MKRETRRTSRRRSPIADLAEQLRADADDPDEVRKALDDAAGMSRNLWLAYLTFGTYLAIRRAVGVTTRDLLLANSDPSCLCSMSICRWSRSFGSLRSCSLSFTRTCSSTFDS